MELITAIGGIIAVIILITALITYIYLILQSSSFTELFLNTAFGWIIIAIPTGIAIAILFGIAKLIELTINLF